MAESVLIYGEPGVTPGGAVSAVRCRGCGDPYVPRSKKQRHCTAVCGWRTRDRDRASDPTRVAAVRERSAAYHRANSAYRKARKLLRARGVDPDTVPGLASLRGRGDLVGADEIKAATGITARERWAGPWATDAHGPDHLEAVGVALAVHPPPPLTTTTLRHMHGAISRLVGRDHHAEMPAWALVPMSPSGWGLVIYDRADALRLVGEHAASLRSTPVRVVVGPALVRLRAPGHLRAGRYRVTLESVTPVVHHRDGSTVAVVRPTVDTLRAACELARKRLGVEVGQEHIESVHCDVSTVRVPLGGHVGRLRAWEGCVTVVCNAAATWLLSCARHTGIGARTAFGLGRVRVLVKMEGET